MLDASHTFSYFFHIGLVALIAVIVAMMATRSMQLVPRGMQNLGEAFLEGVYLWVEIPWEVKKVQENIFLWLQLWGL